MSGIARRIADTLEPETKPMRKPASSISRAPIPSPQPGITCSRGSSRSAFSAAACGRILVSLNVLNTGSRERLLDCRDPRNRNIGSAWAACAQQPLGLFQTTGAEIGFQQGELNQIVLRTTAADALVLTGKGRQRLYRRGEIPPLERGEAARQRRQVGAGGIAPGSGECLDFATAGRTRCTAPSATCRRG